MADITCPVCGTRNPSTRTFCLKCASDLHAVVPDATTVMATPRTEVPIRPILVGGGVALAAIALIAVLVVLLGGSPVASIAPSGGLASAAPTVAGSGGLGSAGSPAPTEAPVTAAPPTLAPEPTAAPATPAITPYPKPKIVSFKGPSEVDCSDQSYDGFITLTWEIDHADGATLAIDGSGLYDTYPGFTGSDRVPFSCGNVQHTYTLTTYGGEGRATKTLTIVENSGV